MLSKLKFFFMNFIVTCSYQAFFDVSKYMTYLEGSVTSVAVTLEVEGGNIVICTSEITKYRSQKYCTCYRSTTYVHPVAYVFGP